jgi:hypothetical protein
MASLARCMGSPGIDCHNVYASESIWIREFEACGLFDVCAGQEL